MGMAKRLAGAGLARGKRLARTGLGAGERRARTGLAAGERRARTGLGGTRLAGAGLAAGVAAASLAGCSHQGAQHPAHQNAGMLALAFSASPVKFQVVTCGRLSPAEQQAAHTRAPFGVVIRARNNGAEALMPTFTVEFQRGPGHKWDGVNYTTSAPDLSLAPGRARDFEADIGSSEWAGHPGDSCLVTQEDVFQIGQFTDVATYRASAVPLQLHATRK